MKNATAHFRVLIYKLHIAHTIRYLTADETKALHAKRRGDRARMCCVDGLTLTL